MRILIAEDDSVLADGLARSLRNAGHAVNLVCSGVEADAAVSAQSFDLLILDVGLPRISGLEVLRRLRNRGANLPVFIVSATSGVEDRVVALDLGADDYLANHSHWQSSKPVSVRSCGVVSRKVPP
ncbi:Regulator of RpoS [compost metagenome]